MKVLLFVQTGDARPKCYAGVCDAARGRGWIEGDGSGFVFTARAALAKAAADRWWLVECANADLGRMAITTQTEQFGRILASGGSRA